MNYCHLFYRNLGQNGFDGMKIDIINEQFIEPYNPQWKLTFEALKNYYLNLLQGYAIDIQHVGSTAIPYMCAKPIIDIDIIIDDRSLLKHIAMKLEEVGYIFRGDQGIQGRYVFRQQSVNTPMTVDQKEWQEHHLYVCYADSLALKNHMFFRDALLKDKSIAEDYALLKTDLVKNKEMTRTQYTQKKTDFIISVLTSIGLSENERKEIIDANK